MEASDKVIVKALGRRVTAERLEAEIGAIEAGFAERARTKAQRARVVYNGAALRLLVAQFRGAPIDVCRGHADRLLGFGKFNAFVTLQEIGNFARYAQELGCPEVGHLYLRRAMRQVDWSKLRVVDVEATRAAFRRLLRELSSRKGTE